MYCHCAKISRNKSDTSRILGARVAFQSLMKNDAALDKRLSELSVSIKEMVMPDNIGECVAAIRAMNRGSLSTIEEMVRECETRVCELQSELSWLEKEDKEYHRGLR